MMKKIGLLVTFIFTCLISSAQDYAKYGMNTKDFTPQGLEVGDIAPDFLGVNQNGEKVSLSDNLNKGKVVLIFYRGYWCPVCSRYLKQYQDSLQLITEKGAQIIAVTPEQEEGVDKTVKKVKADFDIISDRNNEIQKKYDVLFKVTDDYDKKIHKFLSANIAENNKTTEAYLPVPATFIIGADGKIKYVQFDPNYKNRSTVKSMLDNL